MLIDTHSHINDEKLTSVLNEIIQNCQKGDIKRIICPSSSLDSSKTSLAVAQNQNIFCALGVHPENANEYNFETENWLRANLANPKVVAVGEIGLDYHYTTDNKQKQLEVLFRQMELAHKFDLPIIFHIRDSFGDFFDFYARHKDLCKAGVVHCFEGDKEIAKQVLDLGLMISITGLVTFKHREALRETVKFIPLDRLMVETDAPYLAPEPHRGEINRPEFVKYVAQKIAEIKGITLSEVEDVTTQNAYKFFKKMRIFDENNGFSI